MTKLCIDTCGLLHSVSLLNDKNILLHQIQCNEVNMQCEKLIHNVNTLLEISHLKYTDLTQIVVTNGPGTFNGIRIGVSAAHGFAIALNIDIVQITTLKIMQYRYNTMNVCFIADTQIGFILQNDRLLKVELIKLDKKVFKMFDIQEYDKYYDIYNATVAGYISMNENNTDTNILYGKNPSIHIK